MRPGVAEDLGETAAGNLTETTGRLRTADCVAAKDRRPIRELAITGPKSAAVAAIDDPAGKHVDIRKASSHCSSLLALNRQFKNRSKPLMKLKLVADAPETEDLMEMLNAGLVGLIVADA